MIGQLKSAFTSYSMHKALKKSVKQKYKNKIGSHHLMEQRTCGHQEKKEEQIGFCQEGFLAAEKNGFVLLNPDKFI